ncbi:MAG: bifunctional phosphoribosyl-AMP cyclohydrolase/phosphoribosyl-ATP diphosphatase HisIE [Butyrivibrio sp.]|nr:bifunctional phosphoribosyl-AMP cyclohydrolase/phosphoribosyl-ATP diphosphatase HisIE [Butyrivibrio sp.]
MSYKKLIPAIYVNGDKAYADASLSDFSSGNSDAPDICVKYEQNGADGILYYILSEDDASHEAAINMLRLVCKAVDIPVYAAGNIKRAEDVKKYLYAGARAALIETDRESNLAMLTEVTNRFGKDKVGAVINGNTSEAAELIKENGNELLISEGGITDGLNCVVMTSEADAELLLNEGCGGICAVSFSDTEYDFMSLKMKLKKDGVKVNTFESAVPFSDFKLNSQGLIPVVVQDYATDEVLMLAYMNEEAYRLTLETGRMTYYSRSRDEIWVKGLTSGHFQYVMSLNLDCDNDTVLAKVRQVGAACHTGAHSCFFKKLAAKDVHKTNPLKVFNDVMAVILDRKENPKEGSYTNYLFDKGIDKILKKVGEEATEIVIAAKNPDPVEIKYEIADFLYHVMVLMAERGLDWEDVTEELANR